MPSSRSSAASRSSSSSKRNIRTRRPSTASSRSVLRRQRRDRREKVGRSQQEPARRSQDRARLLPRHRARPVRPDLRIHRQEEVLSARRPRGDREAARPRPRLLDRHQRRSLQDLQGRSGLPHRPLSRQRRRCRTCWRCASPISCSSRSGTPPISTTCRSPWPRSSGAGTRGYYDESGALRDMVQNHIIQLLCLVAMEPPASDAANALRDEKLKVLRSLKPIAGADVAKATVRGQYRGGSVDGGASPAIRTNCPRSEGLAHRNLRRAQGRDRELALVRRAVLHPHRQAPAHARLRDRHPVPHHPAFDLRSCRGRAEAPTGWSSACSPTRA
jgi:hypothetical protein